MLAVLARLGALATVAGLTVDRNRIEAVTDADLPILVLFESQETPHEPDESFSGERASSLAIAIEGAMSGASSADAKTQLAVLRAAVERDLLAETLLGGLARDIRLLPEAPPPRLDLACADPLAAFAIGLEIDFATIEDDPFTFAD